MAARPCPFCGARADSREHALPQWLLSRWPGPAPFTVEINGVPLLNRDDKLVTSGHMLRVMLRICKTCNGVLNTRFEETAKLHVRAALDDLQTLDAKATAAFARWMTKTMLLARHPEAAHTAFAARSGDAKNRCHPWTPFPTAALTALLHGKILDDLSLWVAVVDVKASPVQVPAFKRIFLNTTFRNDGAGGTGHAALQGFSLVDGRMAVFQLVFHPLQDFEHPFEVTRLIIRLWPEPPTGLDLATHTVLDPTPTARWVECSCAVEAASACSRASGCLRKDRGHGMRRSPTTGQRIRVGETTDWRDGSRDMASSSSRASMIPRKTHSTQNQTCSARTVLPLVKTPQTHAWNRRCAHR